MMSLLNPPVSIIMATYNRAHYIRETLDSIRKQSFVHFECLIIDDGSSDNTAEVLSPYLLKDARLRYYRRPDDHEKGLPGCRNYGLRMAKGEYVIFFDDDDIVHPDNLKICYNEIKQTSADFCRYLRTTFTGEFRKNFDRNLSYKTFTLGAEDIEAVVTGEIQFNSCQVMWKKNCFTRNNFNESLMYAEEWECYSRILADGAKGISVDKVLFFGRKHAASNTGEFWNDDPIRKRSMIEASKLIIGNLKKKALLNRILERHFVQLGIFLKEKSIIDEVLGSSEAGSLKRIRYRLLYDFYPLIVIGHRTKKYLKRKLF